jgi:3-hydroxybutyrate dehydrogenase
MTSPLPDLTGKTAVVTGSTSGIGHAIARSLASAGAHVVINGLGSDEENAEPLAEIRKTGAGEARFSSANMMHPDQIATLISETEKEFGSVDILVNNAGIQFVSPIEDFPIGKWDAIIAINLSSSFHTIRAAVPGMKKARLGHASSTQPRPIRWSPRPSNPPMWLPSTGWPD